MFKNYRSIDHVFQNHDGYIMQELNSSSLYVNAVKAIRYRKIGIVVTDDASEEIARYASLNGTDGRIEAITNSFEIDSADIVVRAKERTLLEILHNAEKIKKNPKRWAVYYAPSFFPYRIKDGVRLAKIIFRFNEVRQSNPDLFS